MLRAILLLLLCFSLSGAVESTPKNRSAPELMTDRERQLKEKLSNCVFNGRWCLIEKGKLTQEYEDTYTIEGAAKTAKGGWLVYARVEYAGRSFTLPVPVRLTWAGETPVVTLDRVSIPM